MSRCYRPTRCFFCAAFAVAPPLRLESEAYERASIFSQRRPTPPVKFCSSEAHSSQGCSREHSAELGFCRMMWSRNTSEHRWQYAGPSYPRVCHHRPCFCVVRDTAFGLIRRVFRPGSAPAASSYAAGQKGQGGSVVSPFAPVVPGIGLWRGAATCIAALRGAAAEDCAPGCAAGLCQTSSTRAFSW